MRCRDVVDRLSELARDELSRADEAAVAAHLADCANCRAMDRGLRAVPGLVRAAIDDLVATADDRVRDALRRPVTPDVERALGPDGELRKKA
jgi:hypothetical protein